MSCRNIKGVNLPYLPVIEVPDSGIDFNQKFLNPGVYRVSWYGAAGACVGLPVAEPGTVIVTQGLIGTGITIQIYIRFDCMMFCIRGSQPNANSEIGKWKTVSLGDYLSVEEIVKGFLET